jgi:PAS domain-containing protein
VDQLPGHIFYDAQGEPLRMIGVNIDITERKRIEPRIPWL